MTIDEGEFTPDFFKSTNNLRELFENEESIANIINNNIISKKSNLKEIEMAMLSVEDKQDVIAAKIAKEESKIDNNSIEFDENNISGGNNNSNDLQNIESSSEQYLELINEVFILFIHIGEN
jgi:hypothetical protein